MKPRIPIWSDERGAVMAEFALVLPVAVFLLIGTFNLAILIYAVTNLNASADEAARWASIQKTITGVAPSSTAVTAHAETRYTGPRLARTYVYNSAATCGNQVTVTASFQLTTGVYNPTVPISATSCFTS
jgi:Flp pilus assembly protein TadG